MAPTSSGDGPMCRVAKLRSVIGTLLARRYGTSPLPLCRTRLQSSHPAWSFCLRGSGEDLPLRRHRDRVASRRTLPRGCTAWLRRLPADGRSHRRVRLAAWSRSRAGPQRVLHAGLVPAEEDRTAPAGHVVDGLHAGEVLPERRVPPRVPLAPHGRVTDPAGVDAEMPAEGDRPVDVIALRHHDQLPYPEDPDCPGTRVVRVEPGVVEHHPAGRYA